MTVRMTATIISDIVDRLRYCVEKGHRPSYADARDALDEIGRLQAAKRRALQVADERSKENVQLRAVLALRCPQLVADADAEPPRIYGDMYW